jgi:hypothetical protein
VFAGRWGRPVHVPGKHIGPPTETVRPGDNDGLPPLSWVVGWEVSRSPRLTSDGAVMTTV